MSEKDDKNKGERTSDKSGSGDSKRHERSWSGLSNLKPGKNPSGSEGGASDSGNGGSGGDGSET